MQEDPDQFAARVAAVCKRIGPSLSDIDPGDLILIVQSLLRPLGSGRRFLLRAVQPGVYVA